MVPTMARTILYRKPSAQTAMEMSGPSRSALLTRPAQAIGTGKGFGVHKALNLTGGLLGPLAVAGIIAATATTDKVKVFYDPFYGLAFVAIFIFIAALV